MNISRQITAELSMTDMDNFRESSNQILNKHAGNIKLLCETESIYWIICRDESSVMFYCLDESETVHIIGFDHIEHTFEWLNKEDQSHIAFEPAKHIANKLYIFASLFGMQKEAMFHA